jgi:hypothetical protein
MIVVLQLMQDMNNHMISFERKISPTPVQGNIPLVPPQAPLQPTQP